MRKLTHAEVALLKAFPKTFTIRDRQFGGWLLPGQMPKRTNRATLRNLYSLGLIRVSGSLPIECYPVELTEAGLASAKPAPAS